MEDAWALSQKALKKKPFNKVNVVDMTDEDVTSLGKPSTTIFSTNKML